MLINDTHVFAIETKVNTIMSDLALIAASTRTTLLEIAKQAAALGNGLQNAAPGDKTGKPNLSVQYLLGIAEDLLVIAKECEASSSNDSTPKLGL